MGRGGRGLLLIGVASVAQGAEPLVSQGGDVSAGPRASAQAQDLAHAGVRAIANLLDPRLEIDVPPLVPTHAARGAGQRSSLALALSHPAPPPPHITATHTSSTAPCLGPAHYGTRRPGARRSWARAPTARYTVPPGVAPTSRSRSWRCLQSRTNPSRRRLCRSDPAVLSPCMGSSPSPCLARRRSPRARV
jgi:hypothetical protein